MDLLKESDMISGGSAHKLQEKKDWPAWIAYLESKAVPYDIWTYVNPKSTDEEAIASLLSPPKPCEEPTVEEADKIYTEAQEDENHFFHGRTSIQIYEFKEKQFNAYEKRLSRYKMQQTVIGYMATIVRSSITKKYAYLVLQSRGVRDLMKDIQQEFAPELQPLYIDDIRREWRKHILSLSRNVDIDQWRNRLYEIATALNNADQGSIMDDLCRDVLDQLSSVPEMSDYCVRVWEEIVYTQKKYSMREFIDRLIIVWKMKSAPSLSPLSSTKKLAHKGTFSTLQG